MKNEFLSASTEKSVRGVLSSLGVLCAAATVLVFSTLFFSDVSFTAAVTLELTLDFALLYFSSYVMFCSLFETGVDKAEADERFRALYNRRASLFERFREEGDAESLVSFCRAVSERETAQMRRDILLDCMLSEKEWEEAKRKSRADQTPLERRAARQMAKAEPIRITPHTLLAEKPSARHAQILAHPPEEMRRRRSLRFLLITALTALFSASLVFHVAKDPSLDVIVGYLFKLFTLFWSGAKGFRSGFVHADSEKTEYMRAQCLRLDEYFAALGAQNAATDAARLADATVTHGTDTTAARHADTTSAPSERKAES